MFTFDFDFDFVFVCFLVDRFLLHLFVLPHTHFFLMQIALSFWDEQLLAAPGLPGLPFFCGDAAFGDAAFGDAAFGGGGGGVAAFLFGIKSVNSCRTCFPPGSSGETKYSGPLSSSACMKSYDCC